MKPDKDGSFHSCQRERIDTSLRSRSGMTAYGKRDETSAQSCLKDVMQEKLLLAAEKFTSGTEIFIEPEMPAHPAGTQSHFHAARIPAPGHGPQVGDGCRIWLAEPPVGIAITESQQIGVGIALKCLNHILKALAGIHKVIVGYQEQRSARQAESEIAVKRESARLAPVHAEIGARQLGRYLGRTFRHLPAYQIADTLNRRMSGLRHAPYAIGTVGTYKHLKNRFHLAKITIFSFTSI